MFEGQPSNALRAEAQGAREAACDSARRAWGDRAAILKNKVARFAAASRQIAGKRSAARPAPTPSGQKLRVFAKPLVILPEGRGSQLAGEAYLLIHFDRHDLDHLIARRTLP